MAPGGGGQLGGGLRTIRGDPWGVRWHRQSKVLDCGYSHLLCGYLIVLFIYCYFQILIHEKYMSANIVMSHLIGWLENTTSVCFSYGNEIRA